MADFYSKLFRSTYPNISNLTAYITSTDTPVLNDEMSADIDNEITTEGIDAVFNELLGG